MVRADWQRQQRLGKDFDSCCFREGREFAIKSAASTASPDYMKFQGHDQDSFYAVDLITTEFQFLITFWRGQKTLKYPDSV